MVGFIASRSDGWFVCLLISRLELWMVNSWLADWFVRYLVCRSVGQTIRPICYPTSHRLTDHRLTGHLNIPPPAFDQPTKDTSSTSSECLNLRYRGSTYPCFHPADWLRKGCLTIACKPLVMLEEWFIQPLLGIYPSPS